MYNNMHNMTAVTKTHYGCEAHKSVVYSIYTWEELAVQRFCSTVIIPCILYKYLFIFTFHILLMVIPPGTKRLNKLIADMCVCVFQHGKTHTVLPLAQKSLDFITGFSCTHYNLHRILSVVTFFEVGPHPRCRQLLQRMGPLLWAA